MPEGRNLLNTFVERNKAVSNEFWVDPSPSYFYDMYSSLLLRKLLPRGRVMVLLRDPVERAYVDLVRVIAAEA